MRHPTSFTTILALLLAFSSTTLSLPSNPRHANDLTARQSTRPQRATVCGAIYGTGTRNDTYTRNLLQIGDAWLQGFIAPTTGALCSLSFFMTPLPFSVSANASVAVFDGAVEQSQIFAGNATPVAAANTLSEGDQLFFDFCGLQSGLIFEKQPYNLVLTFEGSALPAPLSLVFQPFPGASGSFFGPSFTPAFSLVDEALVFNLTTSLEPPVCPGGQPDVTTTITTTTTSTSTSSSTVTSRPTESPSVTTTNIEHPSASATQTVTSGGEVTSVVVIVETTVVVVQPSTTDVIVIPSTASVPTTGEPLPETNTAKPATTIVEVSTTVIGIPGSPSQVTGLPVTLVQPSQEPGTIETETSLFTGTLTWISPPAHVTGLPVTFEPSQATEFPIDTVTSTSTGTLTFISPPVPSQVTGLPVTPGEPCTAVTVTVTTTESATGTCTAQSTSTATSGVCGTHCALCREHAWATCATAETYTECLKSPTLSLCYQLACAPGQDTDAYLKQCEQLEIWARFTHDDEIPHRW
ncbi:uncharacterized protein EV422DRAFT_576166 [Fimicolochytrium jonesii]|uniref:uncharacterized protein n=1 Tax=Fimicolochytrium jonesii TaxID=1396493 RepID=UPI0022FECF72|nr:uncharacterized protein EV422DRAFT_576166 [Fimicolochytrium jonesii]KAI8824921.1 hypothetical protein EV422DRAFT_576166 [Fimicolochytrium jonesii]